jgi:hypothetical protein
MAGYLFLDMLSSMALGIVEMQKQLATAHILQLLSIPASQWKDFVIDEVYHCEGCVLWQ